MLDYNFWNEGGRTFIVQAHDSCCFIYAVANALIVQGRTVTSEQIEQAKDIGCCRTGSTIATQRVVDFFEASLMPTEYPEEVFQHGGIINIWHPIFNGHSFYLDHECDDEGALRLINSWLGPPIALTVGVREVRHYVTNRCGEHWKRTTT